MFSSSLGKKYLMALTGIVLIGFVFVHMAGNLQVLLGQDKINAYAHALQSLPMPILWGSRLFLLVCVILHAWTAIVLIRENRAARPQGNDVEVTKRAGLSSLKMGLSGTILLFFIVFHLLHFTIRTVYPEYNDMCVTLFVLMPRRALIRQNGVKQFLTGFSGGVLSSLSYALAVFAQTLAPLALVAAIRETSVILAALIGVI